MPAIDPFTIKNRPLPAGEVEERLAHYGIPSDRPLVTQVSRFDPWKDPLGVIQAFQEAAVDATLVLLGNFAADDPEGRVIYEELKKIDDQRILILTSGDDQLLVNAVQQRADVVLQKSLKEGFGLTATEAMWKKRPVIAGDTDGLRAQIDDGESGFIVGSAEQAAHRLTELLDDGKLRRRLGEAAYERVKREFLMLRLVREHLTLYRDLLGR